MGGNPVDADMASFAVQNQLFSSLPSFATVSSYSIAPETSETGRACPQLFETFKIIEID